MLFDSDTAHFYGSCGEFWMLRQYFKMEISENAFCMRGFISIVFLIVDTPVHQYIFVGGVSFSISFHTSQILYKYPVLI
jgi:hypothetical protein